MPESSMWSPLRKACLNGREGAVTHSNAPQGPAGVIPSAQSCCNVTNEEVIWCWQAEAGLVIPQHIMHICSSRSVPFFIAPRG
jgi:hypothetical protein